MFFATVLSSLHETAPELKARNLSPELCPSDRFSLDALRDYRENGLNADAALLGNLGLKCAWHGYFYSLDLASVDETIRDYSLRVGLMDLDCAAALGVDLCGFIFAPQSPRAVTPEQAAALDSGDMLRVGVFVTDDMRFIEETARAARLDRIQLHGDQSMTCADRLSRTLGAERLIRVLWPERYPDLAALEETMNRHAASTGMFLLDAGMSGGGSGKRIGSERLRGLNAPRPWLLAGGLTPENVKETVAACVPGGVDFNSGLESEPGRKDPSRMRAALTALRG